MNSRATPARRKRNAERIAPERKQHPKRNIAARDQERFPREDENAADYYLRLCRFGLTPPVLEEDVLNSEQGAGLVDPLAQGLSHSDIVRSIAFIHHRAVRARDKVSGQGG